MGRPPKPIERKRALGNPGKRPLPKPSVVLPAVVSVPDPLRPLEPVGLAAWNRVWSAGAAWISPQTDIALVQMFAENLDEREPLRAEVMRGDADRRATRALRDLDKQITSILSLLGFTPTDRAKMGFAEVRSSNLDELARRRRVRSDPPV